MVYAYNLFHTPTSAKVDLLIESENKVRGGKKRYRNIKTQATWTTCTVIAPLVILSALFGYLRQQVNLNIDEKG